MTTFNPVAPYLMSRTSGSEMWVPNYFGNPKVATRMATIFVKLNYRLWFSSDIKCSWYSHNLESSLQFWLHTHNFKYHCPRVYCSSSKIFFWDLYGRLHDPIILAFCVSVKPALCRWHQNLLSVWTVSKNFWTMKAKPECSDYWTSECTSMGGLEWDFPWAFFSKQAFKGISPFTLLNLQRVGYKKVTEMLSSYHFYFPDVKYLALFFKSSTNLFNSHTFPGPAFTKLTYF